MKKCIKIFFIILAILLIFIVADTIQAKIFENNPLIKIRYNRDGGNVDYIDKGLLVDTYVFNNGEKVTVFRWEKYAPPEEIQVDSYKRLEDIQGNYGLPEMVEDRCYVVYSSNMFSNTNNLDKYIVYHIDELDNFIKNVENKKSDEIRIVEYLDEDSPLIIKNLQYKDDKFIMQIDNRRNYNASQEDKKIITTEYDSTEYVLEKREMPDNEANVQKRYELILKSNKSDDTIYLCNYVEEDDDDESKFQIQFNENINGNEKTKILGKDETDKYDYNIYSYKGNVDIIINNEKMTLRKALLNNKITIDEILEKANKDVNDLKIYRAYYTDGGSRYYLYEDYSIVKLHTLEGNRDLYIGVPSMNVNDVD